MVQWRRKFPGYSTGIIFLSMNWSFKSRINFARLNSTIQGWKDPRTFPWSQFILPMKILSWVEHHHGQAFLVHNSSAIIVPKFMISSTSYIVRITSSTPELILKDKIGFTGLSSTIESARMKISKAIQWSPLMLPYSCIILLGLKLPHRKQ